MMKMKLEPFAKAVGDVELIFNDLGGPASVVSVISPVFLFFSLGNLWKISGNKMTLTA